MVNILFFGEVLGEIVGISSSVEFAFDLYRNKLSSFMQSTSEINLNMDRIDSTTDVFMAIHEDYRRLLSQIPHCWESNEMSLRKVISTKSTTRLIYAISNIEKDDEVAFNKFEQRFMSVSQKQSSYDSIDQVIIHLDRDWGANGHQLRSDLYREGIVRALWKHMSTDSSEVHRPPPKVLVPGAGLGRLAVEIALQGFRSATSPLFARRISLPVCMYMQRRNE